MTKHDLIRIENTIGSALSALDRNPAMAVELAREAHRLLCEMLEPPMTVAAMIDTINTADAALRAQAGLGKTKP